ncbi:MAG: hypothetical protein QXR42_09495 [Candidatus Bathyarchaeia archaeon]
MKPTKEWTEEEKRWVREGMIFAISTFTIIIVYLELLGNYLNDALNLKPGNISLFAFIGIHLVIFYGTVFFLCSALGEFSYSRIKKRSFRPRNILLFLLMFGEFIVVALILLKLFDVFLSELPLLTQAPFASIAVSIPSIVVALTSRIKKVREYVKKAFD